MASSVNPAPVAPQAISLLELQRRVKAHLLAADLRYVWVTAELSDVRVNGGHCYMELLQKTDRGEIVAKVRAAIWANRFGALAHNFLTVTGRNFTTGLKVMLRATVSYHEAYGLTLVVDDVDPAFTMGDLMRRRRENILRLQREGILELNRRLEFPRPTLRVAVVSARGAAGFGDFVNQLLGNRSRLAFRIGLFTARLQGDGTPQSIIEALKQIAMQEEEWDCVVIIRGGGASSDLIAFEDYDLAAAVAQFPLPVIIGIGHERDTTLLDYVAKMRVKTPTAAAEFLVGEGEAQLDLLRRIAVEMNRTATARIGGCTTRLSSAESLLMMLPVRAIERGNSRLQSATLSIAGLAQRRLAPMAERLRSLSMAIAREATATLRRGADKLAADSRLIEAYSPAATLRRGFTMSCVAGSASALRSADGLKPGEMIATYFADGSSITSEVTAVATSDNANPSSPTQ